MSNIDLGGLYQSKVTCNYWIFFSSTKKTLSGIKK